jgi:hypothetical protein
VAAAAVSFFGADFLVFFCLLFLDGAGVAEAEAAVVVVEEADFFVRCFSLGGALVLAARSNAWVVVTQAERRTMERRRRNVRIVWDVLVAGGLKQRRCGGQGGAVVQCRTGVDARASKSPYIV